jgi:hypothetical protein
MAQGCAFRFLVVKSPFWHQAVHQLAKPFIVMSFEQVDQFVHQNILKTQRGFLGQFKIQPDPPGRCIAATPARFHFPDTNLSHIHANPRLPLGKQWRDLFVETLAIPLLKHIPALGRFGPWPDMQFNRLVVYQTHGRWTVMLDHVKPIATPPEVVAFTRHHFPHGLTILLFERGLLPSNPPEA